MLIFGAARSISPLRSPLREPCVVLTAIYQTPIGGHHSSELRRCAVSRLWSLVLRSAAQDLMRFGEFARVSCASRKADAPRRNRALIDPDLAFGRIAKGDTDRIWTSMMSNIVDCAITRLCAAQKSGMRGSMGGNVALHTSIPFRTTSLCCVKLKRKRCVG